eukprot:jgi/Mesvir1/17181/Mv07602-RA.1
MAAPFPNQIFLINFDRHQLELVICKGSDRTQCDNCSEGIPDGAQKYQCRQCNHDICIDCFTSKVEQDNAASTPNQIYVNIDRHPLQLGKTASITCTCDKCSKRIPNGAQKYQCRQCDNDVCMACFSKIQQDTDAKSIKSLAGELDKSDRARLKQLVDDPEQRISLIEKLTEASGAVDEPAEKAAFEMAITMLKNPNIKGDQLVAAVAKLPAKQTLGEAKTELEEEIAAEIGLADMDPTGVLSAVSLIRAVAKGDVGAVAESAAKILFAKVVLSALCAVQ